MLADAQTSVTAIRLFEHPMLTVALTVDLLQITKPTAQKATDALQAIGVLSETTGKQRDRLYAYTRYLDELGRDAEP